MVVGEVGRLTESVLLETERTNPSEVMQGHGILTESIEWIALQAVSGSASRAAERGDPE